MGNPLSWYSGGDLSFTWAQGRKLTSVDDYMGMCTYQYGYNSDGVRISKNMVDWQETHEYAVNGTTILRETVNSLYNGSYTLYYHYDEVGAISHVTVTSGTASATYYYVKNLQGDVVAVVNEAGAVLVRYTYDAWGRTYEDTAAGISGII